MLLGEWNFSFSTAPAMQGGCDFTQIPGIGLELLRSHRFDEVLAAPCDAENCGDFRRILPEILAGQQPDWFLWNVEVKVDRLKMSFASRHQVQADETLSSQAPQYSIGIVNVNWPTVLGLRFTVPAILDQPEVAYECMMSSSGTGHSHALQLTESYVDPETGATIQSSVHLTQSNA